MYVIIDLEDEAVLLLQHGADMNLPDGEGVRVISDPKATAVSVLFLPCVVALLQRSCI